MDKSRAQPPPPYKAAAQERTSLLASSHHPPPSYTSFQAPRTIRNPVNNTQYPRNHRGLSTAKQSFARHSRRGGICLVALLIVALGFSVGYLTKSSFGGGQGGNGGEVKKEVRVAVVGAGPAGISTAYTLSRLSNLPIPLKITVFEQNDRVGGRLVLASSSSSTAPTRLHGKIFAEDIAMGDLLLRNSILSQRAEKILGRNKGADADGKVVNVGFWDGDGMRSVQSKPIGRGSWAQWFADARRYGWVLWNARILPVGTMRGWRNILASFQRKGTVEMGAITLTAEERLKKNGVTGNYVTEIVESVLQRQFGQSVQEVSDLTLSMALEREFSSPSADRGRFEKTLQSFLDKSGAEIQFNTKIASLQKSSQGDEGDDKIEWTLTTLSTTTNEQTTQIFDKIILAAPWNTSSLLNSTQNEKVEQISYRPLYTTLITSSAKINARYFKTTADLVPEQILPIPSTSSLPAEMKGIHSISFLHPVYGPDSTQIKTEEEGDVKVEMVRYLYSITSSHRLSLTTIEVFWGKDEVEEWVEEEIAHAFPLLYPRSALGLEDVGNGVEVGGSGEGVWHTGAWEGVASSVDWSWVVGERVAGKVGEELRG